MNNYQLTGIFIYPVKSLGGIELKSALTEERGLKYDRRWMLVNEQNIFITQRECNAMALIGIRFADNGFELFSKKDSSHSYKIPFSIDNGVDLDVEVFGDVMPAWHWNKEADNWLQDLLKINCRLVYMHNNSFRYADKNFAKNNEIVSFADGFPFLIIGESSLEDLNEKLEQKLPMNRFRPNLVFTGGIAFEEDNWSNFNIGNAAFRGVKTCGRCMITTINQESAVAGVEPLKTLSRYRKVGNRILFGQNLVLVKSGEIKVGDKITLG